MSKKELPRVIMVGAASSGKTTLLYKLKLDEIVTTIPTIGFNVEEISLRRGGPKINLWDLGGKTEIQPLWRHYTDKNTQVVVVVVDSASSDDEIAALAKALRATFCNDEGDIQENSSQCCFLFAFSKQDLPTARSVPELEEQLQEGFIDVLEENGNSHLSIAYSAVSGSTHEAVEDAIAGFVDSSKGKRRGNRYGSAGDDDEEDQGKDPLVEEYKAQLSRRAELELELFEAQRRGGLAQERAHGIATECAEAVHKAADARSSMGRRTRHERHRENRTALRAMLNRVTSTSSTTASSDHHHEKKTNSAVSGRDDRGTFGSASLQFGTVDGCDGGHDRAATDEEQKKCDEGSKSRSSIALNVIPTGVNAFRALSKRLLEGTPFKKTLRVSSYENAEIQVITVFDVAIADDVSDVDATRHVDEVKRVIQIFTKDTDDMLEYARIDVSLVFVGVDSETQPLEVDYSTSGDYNSASAACNKDAKTIRVMRVKVLGYEEDMDPLYGFFTEQAEEMNVESPLVMDKPHALFKQFCGELHLGCNISEALSEENGEDPLPALLANGLHTKGMYHGGDMLEFLFYQLANDSVFSSSYRSEVAVGSFYTYLASQAVKEHRTAVSCNAPEAAVAQATESFSKELLRRHLSTFDSDSKGSATVLGTTAIGEAAHRYMSGISAAGVTPKVVREVFVMMLTSAAYEKAVEKLDRKKTSKQARGAASVLEIPQSDFSVVEMITASKAIFGDVLGVCMYGKTASAVIKFENVNFTSFLPVSREAMRDTIVSRILAIQKHERQLEEGNDSNSDGDDEAERAVSVPTFSDIHDEIESEEVECALQVAQSEWEKDRQSVLNYLRDDTIGSGRRALKFIPVATQHKIVPSSSSAVLRIAVLALASPDKHPDGFASLPVFNLLTEQLGLSKSVVETSLARSLLCGKEASVFHVDNFSNTGVPLQIVVASTHASGRIFHACDVVVVDYYLDDESAQEVFSDAVRSHHEQMCSMRQEISGSDDKKRLTEALLDATQTSLTRNPLMIFVGEQKSEDVVSQSEAIHLRLPSQEDEQSDADGDVDVVPMRSEEAARGVVGDAVRRALSAALEKSRQTKNNAAGIF